MNKLDKAKWVGGFAEWQSGDTTYLSVAFTWLIPAARERAKIARGLGHRVIAGGPAFLLPSMRKEMHGYAETPTQIVTRERNGQSSVHIIAAPHPDGMVVDHHNPMATFASRGCDQECTFCGVPILEGKFTHFPDFPVRPILCDNNLSGLSADYQDYIVRRYQESGVPLLDANSGFEPKSFTPDVYDRWKPLLNAGGGPWRFALDEMDELDRAVAVMKMLKAEPQRRKRVYVLIGDEPFKECMYRIQTVIDNGCEPHAQAKVKLGALTKEPHVRHDWTAQKLKDVMRWANARVKLWKTLPFSDYNRTRNNRRDRERYDARQGLFF